MAEDLASPEEIPDVVPPRLRSLLAGAMAGGLMVEHREHRSQVTNSTWHTFTIVLDRHRTLLCTPAGRSVTISLLEEDRGGYDEITQREARRLLEEAIADQTPTVDAPAPGQIWRRRKTGALLRITEALNVGSNSRPYHDIAWETVSRPTARGRSYETYWLRDCEFVGASLDDPAVAAHL